MRTLGWLRRNVIAWIDDSSAQYEIDLAINQSIDVLCAECPFSQLMRRVTVTPDAEGIIYSPPRCTDIIDVYPSGTETNGADFVFQGERRVMGDVRRTGYFLRDTGIVETPEAIVRATFTNGSNGITEATGGDDSFSTDHVGSELVIEGGQERYRIESFTDGVTPTFTIYPDYRWADVEADCHIRPAATQKLVLHDSNGVPYAEEVVIEYQQSHPYLVSGNDPILIPAPNTVYLGAVQFMLRNSKYDVDAVRLDALYNRYKGIECSKQAAKIDMNTANTDTLFNIHGRHSVRSNRRR